MRELGAGPLCRWALPGDWLAWQSFGIAKTGAVQCHTAQVMSPGSVHGLDSHCHGHAGPQARGCRQHQGQHPPASSQPPRNTAHGKLPGSVSEPGTSTSLHRLHHCAQGQPRDLDLWFLGCPKSLNPVADLVVDAQHQAVAGVAEAQGGCRGALPPLLLGQQHILWQAQARQVCQHAAARAVVQVLRGGVVDGDGLAAAVVLPGGLPCQCSGLLVISSTTLQLEWGCSCSPSGGCALLGLVRGYGVGAGSAPMGVGWDPSHP